MPLVDVGGQWVFIRKVDWCQRHDIAWASCYDLGLRVPRCIKGERWVEDVTKHVGTSQRGVASR